MNRAQRMEVGSDWSNTFMFKGGTPPMPISISDWTLEGKAWASELPSKSIDLVLDEQLEVESYQIQSHDITRDRLLQIGQVVQVLIVRLEESETQLLGSGMVEIEILRTYPQPTRPILKFKIMNNEGPAR
jgi:hypothetical protein